MFSIFTSCKLGNVNDMREWDLSFGGIQKLVSTPCLNKELILGRPFLIQYIDSSLLLYDDIGDSLFLLLDLMITIEYIVSGKRERVVMSSCKFLLFVI